MWWRSDPANAVERRSAGTLYRARERQDWPVDRDFRILSIDGGGIRGILPLAVLAGLEDALAGGRSIGDFFDLIVGVSTGGIIALGLGAGLRARAIYQLYMERGGEVFPDHCWVKKQALRAHRFLFNRCDQDRLKELVAAILGDRQLWNSRLRLCIPSAETVHFEPFIFKTPHHPDYKKDWSRPMVEIALATSAAPTFFVPVQDSTGYEFVDGGIWANNPVMIGVADALSCFDIRRNQLRVLSLGCVENAFSMSWLRRHWGGMLFWRSIMLESMHIQSQNVIGQARLIAGGDRVTRVDAAPIRPKIELWNWARCRTELPGIGQKLVSTYRAQVERDFFYAPASSYAPAYTSGMPPEREPQSNMTSND